MFKGLLGLLYLALCIWAIVNIAQSGEKTANKLLWIALVLFVPYVGVGVWYFAGPKGGAG